MTAVPKRKLTTEEYLVIERDAEFRSEFYDGIIYDIEPPPCSAAERPSSAAAGRTELHE